MVSNFAELVLMACCLSDCRNEFGIFGCPSGLYDFRISWPCLLSMLKRPAYSLLTAGCGSMFLFLLFLAAVSGTFRYLRHPVI